MGKNHEYQITVIGELLSNQFYWDRLLNLLDEIKVRHAPKGPALPEIVVVERQAVGDHEQELTSKESRRKALLDQMTEAGNTVTTCTGKVIKNNTPVVTKAMPKSNCRSPRTATVVRYEPEHSIPGGWKGSFGRLPSQVSSIVEDMMGQTWGDRLTRTRENAKNYCYVDPVDSDFHSLVTSELQTRNRIPSVQELAYVLFRNQGVGSPNNYLYDKLRKKLENGEIRKCFLAKESQHGYMHLSAMMSESEPIKAKTLWNQMCKQYAERTSEATVAKQFFGTWTMYLILMHCRNHYGFFPSRDFLAEAYTRLAVRNMTGVSSPEDLPDKVLSTGNFKVKLGFGKNFRKYISKCLSVLTAVGILRVIDLDFDFTDKLTWYEFADCEYTEDPFFSDIINVGRIQWPDGSIKMNLYEGKEEAKKTSEFFEDTFDHDPERKKELEHQLLWAAGLL